MWVRNREQVGAPEVERGLRKFNTSAQFEAGWGDYPDLPRHTSGVDDLPMMLQVTDASTAYTECQRYPQVLSILGLQYDQYTEHQVHTNKHQSTRSRTSALLRTAARCCPPPRQEVSQTPASTMY